jgi:hypothetical protein
MCEDSVSVPQVLDLACKSVLCGNSGTKGRIAVLVYIAHGDCDVRRAQCPGVNLGHPVPGGGI